MGQPDPVKGFPSSAPQRMGRRRLSVLETKPIWVRQEAAALKTTMPKEFTSGAHAVFLLGRMCDHISVFGTTAWGDPEDGGYQVRRPLARGIGYRSIAKLMYPPPLR